MILYILTFVACLFADNVKQKSFKILLRIWLYIFLCFGYTVGSDWRNYEIMYTYTFDELQIFNPLYFLFNCLSSFCSYIGIDFWLYTGVCKCIFLSVVIYVIKQFTRKIFFVIALLLPAMLLFFLIEGPFKFMLAMILMLCGFCCLLKKKKTQFWLLSFTSVFVHFAAAVISILIFFLYTYKEKICKARFLYLFIFLLASTIISTFLSFFTTLSSTLNALLPLLQNKIEGYEVVSTENWLTLGSLVNYMLFFILYYTRRRILSIPKGDYLYAGAILARIMFGVCLVIPTGFRFNLFYELLSIIALSTICINSVNDIHFPIVKFRKIAVVIIIFYYSYNYVKTIWGAYQYLPYTNSIPYILQGTSGDNYSKRSDLGFDNYYERTGKRIDRE